MILFETAPIISHRPVMTEILSPRSQQLLLPLVVLTRRTRLLKTEQPSSSSRQSNVWPSVWQLWVSSQQRSQVNRFSSVKKGRPKSVKIAYVKLKQKTSSEKRKDSVDSPMSNRPLPNSASLERHRHHHRRARTEQTALRNVLRPSEKMMKTR